VIAIDFQADKIILQEIDSTGTVRMGTELKLDTIEPAMDLRAIPFAALEDLSIALSAALAAMVAQRATITANENIAAAEGLGRALKIRRSGGIITPDTTLVTP
jgi:hypothetical protein